MEEVVNYVLSLRESPAARNALRRASSPTTEARAYGYLAPWWAEANYRKSAICAFAGLAANFSGIAQEDGLSVGRVAARVVRTGGLTEAGVERKLIVAQSAGLPQLVQLLRSLLRVADRQGKTLDFNNLYWLLSLAEHPDAVIRTRSRQRLLEDFYQELNTEIPSTPTSTFEPSDDTSEPSSTDQHRSIS